MSAQPSRLMAFLYGLAPLAIAASVLFILALVGGRAIQGYALRQEARAIEWRIDQLKREHRLLLQELDYYRGDQYIEKVAREELGLVRPGDVAVAIIPSDDGRSLPPLASPTTVPAPAARKQEVHTWQRWLAIFIGRE